MLPKQYTRRRQRGRRLQARPDVGRSSSAAWPSPALHGDAGRHHPERPRRAARGAQPEADREPAGRASSGRTTTAGRGQHRELAGQRVPAPDGRRAVAREQRHHDQLHARPIRASPPRWPMPSCRPTSTPSLELRVDPARQYSSFFETACQGGARGAGEGAEPGVSAFQTREGHHRHRRAARRRERAAERTVVAADRAAGASSAESGSRQAQAQGAQGDRLQEVLNNPLRGAA